MEMQMLQWGFILGKVTQELYSKSIIGWIYRKACQE